MSFFCTFISISFFVQVAYVTGFRFLFPFWIFLYFFSALLLTSFDKHNRIDIMGKNKNKGANKVVPAKKITEEEEPVKNEEKYLRVQPDASTTKVRHSERKSIRDLFLTYCLYRK